MDEILEQFFKENKADIQESPDLGSETVKMIREIYGKQPLLLLSAFQKSPLPVFLGENSNIMDSIDTRLALIKKCVLIYQKKDGDIRRALKFKLKSYQYVDRIEKLTVLTANTLAFISQNPQYLFEVKGKKGVNYNGKVYLPSKTSVSRNVVDYDIYENRYILSFLLMMQNKCESIKFCTWLGMKDAEKLINKRGINKEKKNDIKSMSDKYQIQYNEAERLEKIIKRLFFMYKKIMYLDSAKDISGFIDKPKGTAIFRQIPEYNVFLKGAFIPWFKEGIRVDVENVKDETEIFKTAVSNPSTTYELYILVKAMEYLAEKGFEFDKSGAKYAGVREKESRYQDYAYEFYFSRGKEEEREEITLFYSPSVYVPQTWGGKLQEKPFRDENVDHVLYRNTLNSQRKGEDSTGKGSHYEPDFIVKYRRGNMIRYLMCDAKHKDYNTVRVDDMPDLRFKYLDSIKVIKPKYRDVNEQKCDIHVFGLLAIYHKHMDDPSEKKTANDELEGNFDIEEKADYYDYNWLSADNEPLVKMLYLSVNDTREEINVRRAILDEILEGFSIHPSYPASKAGSPL